MKKLSSKKEITGYGFYVFFREQKGEKDIPFFAVDVAKREDTKHLLAVFLSRIPEWKIKNLTEFFTENGEEKQKIIGFNF
jgi:hypothetical protein